MKLIHAILVIVFSIWFITSSGKDSAQHEKSAKTSTEKSHSGKDSVQHEKCTKTPTEKSHSGKDSAQHEKCTKTPTEKSHSGKDSAQHEKSAKTPTEKSHVMVKLPTVHCGVCKNTIETGLAKVDGIVSVNVDIDSKMGHINYDPAKIDLAKIEKSIATLGYQANETVADTDAYSKLPACCKLPEDRD